MVQFGDQPESRNVEDRRGISFGGKAGLGGIGTIVIIVVALLFGVDPRALLSQLDQTAPQQQTATRPTGDDPQRRFVAQVLGSTEDVWTQQFAAIGRTYQKPVLVLFDGAVQSACGMAQSATGPFYCPVDRQLYLDMSFFRDMQTRLGAPGDFPRAYVIAHEVGHHVQNLLGTMTRMDAVRASGDRDTARAASIDLELQADCYAGVWAKQADMAHGILERGDIEAGLNAAAAIGDDRLQMRSRGYVVPESFTHGTSAQRVAWFRRGLQTGNPGDCDTFRAAQP
jgi:predicted metalloprotease